MVQKQLSDRELEALRRSLLYYFGMSKEHQNDYAGFLKKLYSSKILSEVIREKAEEYKTTKKWPTADDIETAYWIKIRQAKTANDQDNTNCQHCQGAGTMVAVESAQGLVDWKTKGVHPRDDIAPVLMCCPCPWGEERLNVREKELYPKDVRTRCAEKYSFGSERSQAAWQRADDYVLACSRMLHGERTVGHRSETVEDRQSEDWNETVRERKIECTMN